MALRKAKTKEQMEAALYLNHPYGRPVIGWRHEIEQLDRKGALEFYRRFYTPNNAIVVIAGDVNPEEVRALAQDTYGRVPRITDVEPRLRPQEPVQQAARTVTLKDPRVTQPSMARYYLVPSSTTARPGESEALDVLTHILGRGSNSRLYQTLVIDKGIAVNAGASDAVIAEVAEHGVTADELARAKTRLVADFVYAQDNQMVLARFYGLALTTGSTVADLRARPEHIRAVSAEQVRDAARRWLDKRRSVTGYLVKESRHEENRS